ncbi:hypothetical protein JM658_11535 [Joostella atrarenae]|uniref:Uncharacterized protein n=1 Tax=Joostella atrarenae TaxID=679257 RepID=A0ABS9J4X0_9FLAO|nr:hypothetical protein [Joostella atrarenae]MCF8715460.1 hypothetical protein [Joostella atrarenae]
MYYLKQTVEDLEEVFRPYTCISDVEYTIEKFELPIYKEMGLYENVFIHFAYWDDIDITYESITIKDFIGGNQKGIEGLDIDVDYEEILESIDIKEFKSFLLNYVQVQEGVYLSNLNNSLIKSNEVALLTNIMFKEKILNLKNSEVCLINILSSENINPLLKIMVNMYLSSYRRVIDLIKVDYGDVYPILISSYLDVKNNTKLPNTGNIDKFLRSNEYERFLQIEKKLMDKDVLDNDLKWMLSQKKTLVLFFLYVKQRSLLKTHFSSEKDNSFLKALEVRYKFNVNDQGKPSKYNNISTKLVKAEFYYLDSI